MTWTNTDGVFDGVFFNHLKLTTLCLIPVQKKNPLKQDVESDLIFIDVYYVCI